MAYAWAAVEELRYHFGNDKTILELIKTTTPAKFRYSEVLTRYHTFFEKEDLILKKFYKYMYLYLENKNEEI